jgi:succinyl-diaminopimelate desuccinylase
MIDNILNLAKQFITINSVAGNTENLGQILNLALINLNEFTIEKFEKNNVHSALVYNTAARPKKFKILFNLHLDVIPGKKDQNIPVIKDNQLMGLGANDMKASAVAVICVFKELAPKLNYPIALQLVTDEEIGGFNGTKHQVENGVAAEIVIAAEPTNLDIVHKAKGILQLRVVSHGESAHSAYPWKGVNAIEKMSPFLEVLNKKYPNPKEDSWTTTVNISSISTTNHAFNKIPADCTAEIDIRYITKDVNIIESIKQLLPNNFDLDVIVDEPAMHTDINNKYVNLLEKAASSVIGEKTTVRGAHGSSDARHFAGNKTLCIEFGAVGGGMGSDSEWVEIASLETYHKILIKYLESLENAH